MPAMYCIQCRYDLRATPSGPCPECGRVFDANDPSSYLDPTRRPSSTKRGEWAWVLLGMLLMAGLLAIPLWPMLSDPNGRGFLLMIVVGGACYWLPALVVIAIILLALRAATSRPRRRR